MRHSHVRRRFVLLLLCLLTTACTAAPDQAPRRPEVQPTAPAGASAQPIEGGTVVFGIADDPGVLNPWLAASSSSTALISRPVLASLWRVLPDGTHEPWLLDGEPEVAAEQDDAPFSVTYRIRRDATWSDGEPIDGADVLFTLELCQDGDLAPRAATECAAVDLEQSTAEDKQITVAFERPYAAWRTLLARLPVLPEHELRGRDPTEIWAKTITLSSGPFRFSSWTPGRNVVLVRNERWWGPPPSLDRIVFRVDPHMPVQPIATGAIDVAEAPATPDMMDRTRASTGVRADVQIGPWWEGLDFNVDVPGLERAEIRRALAQAVDRQTLVDELIAPIDPTARVRDDVGIPINAAPEARLGYPRSDPQAARRALAAAGCATAEDDVLVCDGRRMELDLVVASDDETHQSPRSPTGWQQSIVGEYVRSQLARVDVRVNVRGADAADGPSEGAAAQQSWDLRVAAVAVAPDPALASRRWRCDDQANTQSFCSPVFDALADRAERTLDSTERDAAYADAALLLARELPTLPLYDVPVLLLRTDAVRGPTLNAGPWGATWNTEDWARTRP